MSSMLIAQLREHEREFVLTEAPIPKPGPGECLVRIDACGICGSDLHVVSGEARLTSWPRVLGHEAAGTVAEIGAGADPTLLGRAVAIDPIVTCGTCKACRSGKTQICARRTIVGIHRDGAFAQYTTVPEANLILLPVGLALPSAALIEPIATPFHALTSRLSLCPAETIAIIGVGGLGIHAVQIASKLGAGAIIAIDRDPVALERARFVGATHLIESNGSEVSGDVRAIVADGVDVSLDCVGLPATADQAVRMLAPGGRAGIIGIGYEALRLPSAATLTWKEVDVRGVYGYTHGELSAVAELLASGYLMVDHAITGTYPLAQINEGLEHFRSRRGSPVRILIEAGASS